MKFINTKIVVLSLLLCNQINAQSQEYWDLQKCIEYALEKNIALKQSLNFEQSSKADILKAKADYLPNLNATSNIYSLNHAQNTYSKSSGATLNLNVTLFNGLQRFYTLKKAKIESELSQTETNKIEFNITLNVFLAYLQVLIDEENVSISENMLGISLKQMKQIEKMHDAGLVNKLKLLNIKSQVSADQLQVLKNQSAVKTSYVNLYQYLNINALDSFKVVKPILAIYDTLQTESLAAIYNKALEFVPQIKSAILMANSRIADIKIAKAAYSPSLTLAANASTNNAYNTGIALKKQWFTNNPNQMVALTLSIPIFNNLNVKTNVTKVKIAYVNAQLNVRQLSNNYIKIL